MLRDGGIRRCRRGSGGRALACCDCSVLCLQPRRHLRARHLGTGRARARHARHFGQFLETLARLAAEFRLQGGQVAAHVQLAAMLVDHLEIHEVMGRQGFRLEVRRQHVDGDLRADVEDDGVYKIAAAKHARFMHALAEFRRIVGQRHAVAAQLLRQGF